MSTLVLTVILTPLLIGGATLAGRRFGQRVSGLIVSLPFISGPVVLIVAIAHGRLFAVAAAVGTLAGTSSVAVLFVAYGWLAKRRSWLRCALASIVAFGAVSLIIDLAPLPSDAPLVTAGLFIAVCGVLGLAIRFLPRPARSTHRAMAPTPAWDLPAKIIVATVLVLVLTAAAPIVGGRLAGVLSTFPIYPLVLTVFAHSLHGPESSFEMISGFLIGLFSFAAYFFILAELLPLAGVAVAFVAATALTLLIQLGMLQWVVFRARPAMV